MRKVPTPLGPFPFQLYFEDLGEIDAICLDALKTQSLLPSWPAPIRIERFVEKQFKTALRYEDLGPETLGGTIFNSSGAVEAILVSRSLEEQNTIPARRRVRSTVAHEAGHGLLHGPLFAEVNFPNPQEGPVGKIIDSSYADQRTFWLTPNDPTEADGGNSRQTKPLEVFCFLEFSRLLFWMSRASGLIPPQFAS
jgi:hypothetical protein